MFSHSLTHRVSLPLCLGHGIPMLGMTVKWQSLLQPSLKFPVKCSVFGQNYTELSTDPSMIYICFVFILITKILKPPKPNFNHSLFSMIISSSQHARLLLLVFPTIEAPGRGNKEAEDSQHRAHSNTSQQIFGFHSAPLLLWQSLSWEYVIAKQIHFHMAERDQNQGVECKLSLLIIKVSVLQTL